MKPISRFKLQQRQQTTTGQLFSCCCNTITLFLDLVKAALRGLWDQIGQDLKSKAILKVFGQIFMLLMANLINTQRL